MGLKMYKIDGSVGLGVGEATTGYSTRLRVYAPARILFSFPTCILVIYLALPL